MPFEANAFVDECKILVPAAQFQTVSVDEFTMDFTKTVFDEFASSDYYAQMSDAERIAAIKELDKIEMIRQADGIYRLDHAVTATQKDILQAFNMTAASVKKEAAELGKSLGTLTN